MRDFTAQVNNISLREDFTKFLSALLADLQSDQSDWGNNTLDGLCCMALDLHPLLNGKSTGMANFEIAKPTKLSPEGPVPCQNYIFLPQ